MKKGKASARLLALFNLIESTISVEQRCVITKNRELIMVLSQIQSWWCELANSMSLRCPEQNVPIKTALVDELRPKKLTSHGSSQT